MYDKDTDEFVKNNFATASRSNLSLKITGNVVTFKEFHEGTYAYNYQREKKRLNEQGTIEDITLGRASEADEEGKAVNRKRTDFRRKQAVMDKANCNAGELDIWHTYVDYGNTDLTTGHEHRRTYQQRLERFVQTGKLYGTKVNTFQADPTFELKLFGVVAFQDGKRNKNKSATGFVHFHQLMNTPYLPQLSVITAKVRDSKTLQQKEMYLNLHDGVYFWSPVANRKTLWFQSQKEAEKALMMLSKEKKLPGLFFNRKVKKLCVAALLWEHGFIDIRKVRDLNKQGKCSNIGEYMVSQYMAEQSDDKLQGRKAHFKKGELEKPEIIRDPIEVMHTLLSLFAEVKYTIGEDGHVKAVCERVKRWQDYIMKETHLIGEYIGAMTIYTLNLLFDDYPWMKVYYDKRRQGERMETVDWIAAGVIDELQPSFSFAY